MFNRFAWIAQWIQAIDSRFGVNQKSANLGLDSREFV